MSDEVTEFVAFLNCQYLAESGGERQVMVGADCAAVHLRRRLRCVMTQRGFDIRSYRKDDEADVVALWTQVFPDSRPWNQPLAYIQRKLAVQPELFLVGAHGGRVVATVLGGYDGVRGWIYHLAVAPEQRRHGYGRAMMGAVEARLRALGCAKINLQIVSSNGEVAGFYERLGYALEDRISMGRRLA